jgi:hypothetical protein
MIEPAETADLLPFLSRSMRPPNKDVQIAIERASIADADPSSGKVLARLDRALV